MSDAKPAPITIIVTADELKFWRKKLRWARHQDHFPYNVLVGIVQWIDEKLKGVSDEREQT